MKKIVLVALACLMAAVQSNAQTPAPAPTQKAPILIFGATAHLGNGSVIPNSAIAFEGGKLTLVADATTIRIDRSKYAKIFDASGKHVYPGFIAADAQIGLVEIEAARPTVDYSETGSMNPNLRAIVAYNTDSDIPPTLRSNGVLMAQIAPTGGTLSGSSSVVQLDAWNWEDAAYLSDEGIHLNWPAPMSFGGFANPQITRNDQYDKQVQEIHRFFAEAQAYAKGAKPAAKNIKLEAMRGLFDQKQTLYIHTNSAKTIQESVLFAEKMGVRPVLIGATEAWLVTDFLVAHKVPVILGRTHSLPSSDDDDIDQPYKLAAQLHQAGVLFAIGGEGSWQERNLAFQAGQAVGFGLPYEAGVSSLTGNMAKILRIDATTGTLETGKDATLFISEGDALDMRTCKLMAAFIQGREISLDNKHKQLYKRYEEKYKKQ